MKIKWKKLTNESSDKDPQKELNQLEDELEKALPKEMFKTIRWVVGVCGPNGSLGEKMWRKICQYYDLNSEVTYQKLTGLYSGPGGHWTGD